MVELTITVLVIGILSAVGLPRISHSYQSSAARNAAHQLASDLITFRERCRIESRELTIVWDPSQRRYYCPEIDFLRRYDGSFRVTTDFAPGNSIQFDCEGRLIQPVGRGTIVMGNDPAWQIEFGGSTGRVAVQRAVEGGDG